MKRELPSRAEASSVWMVRIDTDRIALGMLTVVSLLELGLGGKVRHGVQLHLRCVKKCWISGGGGRL